LRAQKDTGVTPKICVMLGEGIQVDLVLGTVSRALRTPPIHGD
jgi:hypothetical protein